MIRRTQGLRQIARNVVAGNRNHGSVADGAVGINRNIGRATANIDHAHAQFFFVFGQHRFGANQRLQHNGIHFQLAAFDTFLDILQRRYRTGNDVHARIQAHSAHTDGFTYAQLVVDNVFLHHCMQDLVVRRNIDGFCGIFGTLHIRFGHFAVFNFYYALRIKAANMVAGNPRGHAADFAACHALCLRNHGFNILSGRIDIGDHAGGQSARFHLCHADNIDFVIHHLAHQSDNR